MRPRSAEFLQQQPQQLDLHDALAEAEACEYGAPAAARRPFDESALVTEQRGREKVFVAASKRLFGASLILARRKLR